jgi:ABC-type nitrate/sulfonate/bicarbonate transport system substrate-binding protein
VFGKRLLQDEPDVGVRFLAAYLKGVAQYNEGKTDRNVEIMVDGTGLDATLLQQACWVDIYGDGHIDFSSIESFQQWSVDQGQLDNPVTEEQFWDPSVLIAALELLNQ